MKYLKCLISIILMLLFVATLCGQNYLLLENRVGIGIEPDVVLDINAEAGQDALRVRVNGATRLRVLAATGVTIGGNPGIAPANGLHVTGNTSLGTTLSTERLTVNGSILLLGGGGYRSFAGTLRWNTLKDDFEVYDGSSWLSLTD